MDPQLLEELKAAFDVFDKNGDGTICKHEIIDIFEALELETSEEQVEKILKENDIDGDGKIDFEEFLKLMTTKRNRRDEAEEMRKMFIAFDLDESGKISSDELKEVLGKMGVVITSNEITEMMEEADTNGDGEVDYEEFLSVMARVS